MPDPSVVSPVRAKDLNRVVERAISLGAAGVEVRTVQSSGLDVRIAAGRVTDRSTTALSQASVRVFVDDGASAEATGTIDQVNELVAAALAQAADAPAAPGAGPARRIQTVDARILGIDDRRYSALSESDRVDCALALERGTHAVHPSVQVQPLHWTDQRIHRAFASSTGLYGEEAGTKFTVAAGVRVANDHSLVALSDDRAARSFATLSSIPFGGNLAKRALSLLEPSIEIEGAVRVMFRPSATAALFIPLADALAAGPTFVDERVLDKRVHLLDDGQLAGGIRAHAFDDRGVPPVPVVVIREGKRDEKYLAPADARAGDVRPTGHWFDGALRPSNLVLRGGTRSINAVLSERSDVDTLIVSDIAHTDEVDWKTGEAKLTVYGVLRRGNKVLGQVPGVTLTANLGDVFSQVVDLASDTDRIRNLDASALLVDGFVVA